MTKETCIEKVCSLPVDFRNKDKSSLTLLQESKFLDFYKYIKIKEIKDYLARHLNLISEWKIWSEDKRTSGYYLSSTPENYFVGSLDKEGKENFAKSFTTPEDACAEFIFREISSILDIKVDIN